MSGSTPPMQPAKKDKGLLHWINVPIEWLLGTVQTPEQLETTLFNSALSTNNSSNLTALQMFVESSEALNNRRQGLNSFFLTINTAILGGLGWLVSDSIPKGKQPDNSILFELLLCSALGILLAVIWFFFIRSYRLVSKSKIEITKKIEEKEPLRVFTSQYAFTENNPYLAFTTLEAWTIIVFFVIYGVIFVYASTHFSSRKTDAAEMKHQVEIEVKGIEDFSFTASDKQIDISSGTAQAEGAQILVRCKVCGLKSTTEIEAGKSTNSMVLNCPHNQ